MGNNDHYTTGLEQYKAGDYKAAIQSFSQAIEADSKNSEAFYERAMCFYHLEQFEESLVDMNHAQHLEPDNPFRYSSRAYIKDRLGDTAGAVEDYKIAVKLDPEDAVAYNNLGLLEEKLGYIEQSKETFAKADKLAEIQNLMLGGVAPDTQDDRQKEVVNSTTSEVPPKAPGSAPAQEEEEAPQKAMHVMINVLRSRESRSEFFRFIKNGFRIK